MEIVEMAVDQIVEDVQSGNTDAIFALIMQVKQELLLQFLLTETV